MMRMIRTARWAVKGPRGASSSKKKWMQVWWTDRGVCAVTLPSERAWAPFPLAERVPGPISVRSAAIPAAWRRSLTALLEGKPVRRPVQMDVAAGTSFEQAVWRATRRIPAGSVRSYQDVARRIGVPRAMQAVGQALKRNPVPLLVPCHRVVQAARTLGGFSGGAGWKEQLLVSEGCKISKGKILR